MPTSHKRDQELIVETLHKHGLAAHEILALELAEPSVQFKATRASVPLGASKLGGEPDLPPDEPWPTRNEIPFSFVGQLDLAEVARHLPSSPLPGAGLLLFFYDVSGANIGRECCRVIHAPGHVARRAAPAAPPEDFIRFPECRLELAPTSSVPNMDVHGAYGDRISDLDDKTQSSWWYWSRDAQSALQKFSPLHEVLGYPYPVQPHDPLVERLAVDAPGLDWHDTPRRCAEARTHRQLVAFGADYDAGMPWADGGLWFLIDRDDLARHDFSRVSAIVQLG